MRERLTPPPAPKSDEAADLAALCDFFEANGGSDLAYLRTHYRRLRLTKKTFEETWKTERGVRILDIGAHWLHQATIYARDGYRVTAADFASTLARAEVKAAA